MPDELNLNLLRAYIDGELPADQASRVRELLANQPHWQRIIEAEQQMRDRVKHAMDRVEAPAELRERITTQIAAEVRNQSSAESAVAATPRPAERPGHDRPGSLAMLAALFSRQQQMRISAPAVVLTIVFVTAVVLFGIFGPQIDRQDGQQPLRPSSLLSAAAAHVSQEHDRCATDENALSEKLIAMDAADAASRLQAHLGADVIIFDFSELGYEFVGVGYCSMPGADRSAHLIYRRNVPDEPQSMMSVFVVPNDGQFPAKCSESARMDGRWSGICGGKGCTKTIVHGTDDQLVYFLACGFPEQVQLVSRSICKTLARRGR